ncbi:MAG: ribonuclease HI [Thaumarchaeota archaeon]|nr:ribonuclease HI [Nitrososphaerota archaeon]
MKADPRKKSGSESVDKKQYIVYFDGLCEPRNPGGVATYGVVVKERGKTVFQEAGLALAKPWTSEASNNVAEYSALIQGLQWLKNNNLQNSSTLIRGDSRLIINQMRGLFKVKAKRLVELHLTAVRLQSEFKDIHFEWIDRSLNKEADLLSRVAYSRYMKSYRKEVL